MARWEYMVVHLPHTRLQDDRIANEKVKHIYQMEAILNEWGAQGWEVVNHASGYAWGGDTGMSFVLKRGRG